MTMMVTMTSQESSIAILPKMKLSVFRNLDDTVFLRQIVLFVLMKDEDKCTFALIKSSFVNLNWIRYTL